MNIEQAVIDGNESALIAEMTGAQYSLEEIHEVLRLLHELTKIEKTGGCDSFSNFGCKVRI